MHYSVVRLRGVRVAVVLVDGWQLAEQHARPLVRKLQAQLTLGVMLVARDAAAVNGLKAYADFDAQPYLFALLAGENIEWSRLPDEIEPELPF